MLFKADLFSGRGIALMYCFSSLLMSYGMELLKEDEA